MDQNNNQANSQNDSGTRIVKIILKILFILSIFGYIVMLIIQIDAWIIYGASNSSNTHEYKVTIKLISKF